MLNAKIVLFTAALVIAPSSWASLKLIGQITSLVTVKIKNHQSHISSSEDQKYRELFPYFMDGCAAGQKIHKNGERGSTLGHGAIFLKGACIDKTKNFPQLTTACAGKDDEVGVSSNGQFTNLNWIAVPTEETFFFGDIQPGTVLDEKVQTDFVEKMANTGIFDPIIARVTATNEMLKADSREEYLSKIIRESMTLEMALTWGRQTVCQRVPLSKAQLDSVVKYMNELNQHYFVDKNEYKWKIDNNCGHFAHNAFAAAGILKERTVDNGPLRITSNIVIPSNFFYDLAKITSYDDFPTARELYRDRFARKLLLEQGIVANQAGALTRYYPVYGFDNPDMNQLHDPAHSTTGIIPFDLFGRVGRKVNTLFTEPRHFDLKTNLEFYKGSYTSNLDEARREQGRRGSKQYKAFLERYIDYVERELALTEERILKLHPVSHDGRE